MEIIGISLMIITNVPVGLRITIHVHFAVRTLTYTSDK